MPLRANLFLEPHYRTSGWLITYTLVPSTCNVPPASEEFGMWPELKELLINAVTVQVVLVGRLRLSSAPAGASPTPDTDLSRHGFVGAEDTI
jgi:hypothetical protein